MNGQSCRETERGGMGLPRFLGGLPLPGAEGDVPRPLVGGIRHDRRIHLARQYMALPRTWQLLRMESSVSRDACYHVP